MIPLTAASGFKRLGLAIAAVVAIGVGALAATSLLIPAASVRNAVKAEIRSMTGLDPVFRGDVSVSLFPWGSARFADVALSAAQGAEPVLVAEELTAHLRILPLVFGRIEAADLALVRPRIAVTIEPDGRSNWSRLVDSLAGTLKPSASRADIMSFSEIRITDGIISIQDKGRGIDETLSNVEMSLAWPSISKSFAATGRFVWRDAPIDASVGLADLYAALDGQPSGLKVRLSGAPLNLAFEGHISHKPTLKMEGTLAVDSPSLRDALQWAGQKPLPGGGFGRFALKAHTDVVGGTVALTSVNVELDGNTAEGVLTFATDGRNVVQGTLAADEVDFTPYVSTVHLLKSTERDWSQVPIMLDGLTDFDLDLRLSAARIALADAKLGRTAVAVNLRDGHMNVTIGESQAFGGVLKGSLGLARVVTGAEITSHLQFSDVDLESCLGDLFGVRRVEGKGNLGFEIAASGDNVLALTRTVTGTASLSAHQGALAGINVEQLLRRLQRRPLSGGSEFRSGRTPFDKLSVSVKFADGIATVDDVSLEGPAVRLEVAGSASIPSRDIDLKGTASLVPTSTSDATPFELPFVVQGPWDDPIMLPDAESLIRRSGAAAPLLDAIKDRKARDAVRSAIERLTGGRTSAPPVLPETAPVAAEPNAVSSGPTTSR